MGQDFLSQEEVDALLKGVDGEPGLPGQPIEPSSGVRPCDLATQERIVRGRMPTLELIHERYTRYLRLGLLNYMQRDVEVFAGPICVQKYSEFVRRMAAPSNLNLVQVKPLQGTGLIVFEPDLVFLVVDNMFGGGGRSHAKTDGRDFSPTEQHMIRGLLRVVFAEFERAWSPVFQIQFEYVRSEMNSQFAHIAAPSELVVATTFTLEFRGASANMYVCLPYSMLEPIRDALSSAMRPDGTRPDIDWVGRMTRQINGLDVELVADLGTAALSLREVASFKVGDVIALEIPETIQASVDEVAVLECTYGTQRGRYALRVERFIHPDDSEFNRIADKLGVQGASNNG